jgi:hypothetical protein
MTSPLLFVYLLAVLLATSSVVHCVEKVPLGDCQDFSVMAGTAVTFDGDITTIYNGKVGISPGTSFGGAYSLSTGATPEVTIEAGNDLSAKCAASELIAHLNATAARTGSIGITKIDIANTTYGPGVYTSTGGITFTAGNVTLDGQGDSNAVFLFQAASTLVTGEYTSFELINGARAENIFWGLGSAATLGAYSVFEGTILAYTAISIGTSTIIHGRALAQTAVTFEDSNSVTLPVVPTTTSTQQRSLLRGAL